MTGSNCIFITNNGLTDHIGVAQILPYLQGLANLGHEIRVISVEDPWRWKSDAPAEIGTERSSRTAGSLRFCPIFRKPATFGRFQRFIIPRQMGARLRSEISIRLPDLIHCRSYMPLGPSLSIAKARGVKVVFDVRGFWIDQRIESGAWSTKNLLDRATIEFFRRLEARGYGESARIVTLTQDAKDIISRKPSYRGAPIDVIPCSVDQQTFDISSLSRSEVRSELSIPSDTLVVSYLGSNSGVYRLDLVYRVYAAARSMVSSARLFLVGTHDIESHRRAAAAEGVRLSAEELITCRVPHKRVPALLNASDIGLSFCISTPSSYGVSATKVGEYLACGLPVGSNKGVGDIDTIIRVGESGAVLVDDSTEEIERVARVLVDMAKASRRAKIKAFGRSFFSLETAVGRYDAIYRELGTHTPTSTSF